VEELCQIFLAQARANKYELSPSALGHLHELMAAAWSAKGPGFGNGRVARTAFERSVAQQADRLSEDPNPDLKSLCTFEGKDIVM